MRATPTINAIPLLFCVLLLLPGALAFQVTPAKQERVFEPNIQEQFLFKVINTEDRQLQLSIRLEGDMAPYATHQASMLLGPYAEGQLRVDLSLPEELLPPGTHELQVIITEVRGEAGTVAAVAELVPVIKIAVPYEKAYVDYSWNLQHSLPIRSTLTLRNLGGEPTNVEYQFLHEDETLVSDATQLAPGQSEKLQSEFASLLAPGVYTIGLRMSSPGLPDSELFAEQETSVGLPSATVTATYPAFDPQEIVRARFDTTIGWNTVFQANVWGKVIDVDGKEWIFAPEDVAIVPGKNSFSLLWETGTMHAPFNYVLYIDSPYGRVAAEGVMVEQARPRFYLSQNLMPLIVVVFVLLSMAIYLICRLRKAKRL